jgi:NCAIR mutase (PurE)-related protein
VTSSWKLFTDLTDALASPDTGEETGVRLDLAREERAGIPEVVLAGSKQLPDLVYAIDRLVSANGRAIASRCDDATIDAIENAFAGDYRVEPLFSTVVVSRFDTHPPTGNGTVGVLTAGTSDNIVAAEATTLLREMGVDVILARDAGVAGLHRLVNPLRRMAEADVDAIIVAAGMDGALPSVVAGLVPVAVIGLPVSTGYGVGGNGEAALHSMLQSCAPGLSVVNIDNGIGAAASAGLIAKRAAAMKRSLTG